MYPKKLSRALIPPPGKFIAVGPKARDDDLHSPPYHYEPLGISRTEACHVAGVGLNKLDELIAEKKLNVIEIGRRKIVTVASLKRLFGVNSLTFAVGDETVVVSHEEPLEQFRRKAAR